MDRPEASAMSSCHILVQRIYSLCPRHLSVFFVHIVCAGTRVVANPYTKILNLGWAALVDLLQDISRLSMCCL